MLLKSQSVTPNLLDRDVKPKTIYTEIVTSLTIKTVSQILQVRNILRPLSMAKQV
jgi:hypothetical protein